MIEIALILIGYGLSLGLAALATVHIVKKYHDYINKDDYDTDS